MENDQSSKSPYMLLGHCACAIYLERAVPVLQILHQTLVQIACGYLVYTIKRATHARLWRTCFARIIILNRTL